MGMEGHQYAHQNATVAKNLIKNSYAVYVMRCQSRDEEFVGDYAIDILGRVPEWAEEAAEYDTIYYIGSTGNPLCRMGAHLNGRGADFTRLFPTETIMEMQLCTNEELARIVEEKYPQEYREWETRYCYSDLDRWGN